MEKMFPNISLPIGETLKLVNLKFLSMNEEVNNFISYFCMVINLKTGESKYSCAGHDLPYIRDKNGKITQLEKCKGTFLGLFDFMEFSEKYYTFQPGDILFAFTDGVTEAMNSERKMFGKDNLVKAISIENNHPAEIIKSVDSSISGFIGDYPQSDDICIACFKFDK